MHTQQRTKLLAGLVLMIILVLAFLYRTETEPGQAVQDEVASHPLPPTPPSARPAVMARAMAAITPPGPVDTTIVDMGRLNSPEEAVRLVRHQYVKLCLDSPARQTPEFAQLAALCRQHGQEPWAIGPAYHFAWEMTSFDRFRSMAKDHSQEMIAMIESSQSNRIMAQLSATAGISWTPEFLAAIRHIQPTVFLGQRWEVQPRPGEKLADTLSWADLGLP